jgi:DNA-binding NtrC family response regulator
MKNRIIIFDDDHHILLLLKTFLSDENYEVVAFSTPLDFECLQNNTSICQRNENQSCAEAIITDFNMPEMDGVKLLDRLKTRNCKIKKLALMTGNYENLPGLDNLLQKSNIKLFKKPFPLSEISTWLNV